MLQGYGYKERFEWILKKKDEGNEAFKTCQHFKAVDIYIQALCAMDFSRKEYQPLTKDQQHDIDFKLKIPILNNMALSFIVKAGEFSHDLDSVNQK